MQILLDGGSVVVKLLEMQYFDCGCGGYYLDWNEFLFQIHFPVLFHPDFGLCASEITFLFESVDKCP